MSFTVFTSAVPSLPVYKRSIFTHLFFSADPDTVGEYPASYPAFIDATTDTTLTRYRLKELALSFAHGLLTHPKLMRQKRGDTVLLYLSNSIAFPVVMFGCVAAGIKCSPANTAYTSRELEHQYRDSGANIVVTNGDGLAVVHEMFQSVGLTREEAGNRIVVVGAGLGWIGGPDLSENSATRGFVQLDELLTTGTLSQEEMFQGDEAHQTCYICYSSGTTGKPKGVETTHQNLTTVIDIARPGLPIQHSQDRILGVLPFYHIYGAVGLLHIAFKYGVPVVVQNRFDAIKFCQNIQTYKITVAMVVPPILVVLARHPGVDQYDLSTLKLVFSAAAPLGPGLIRQVKERFSSKGSEISVTQGYGLTETSPTSHILPPGSSHLKPGSIGILLPNLEARIVESDDGDALIDAADGKPGELWIRGPTIMKGYLNNTEATLDSITNDGWFKSGDVAVRDRDGFYWIVDRRKELIKYKGFQVAPSELESVLLTHPKIVDVAVIGVDDLAEATELPRAYVVRVPSAQGEATIANRAFAEDVKKWMESKVASHKLLRGGVSVIEEIPKSAAGKILRRELRERAKQEFVAQPLTSKL